VRIAVEERTSFSPDALTGMEASLRFPGPETLETKIFGRLSAWQNWIFQRPNAVGEEGALQLYGTGRRAKYNPQRV
jgi:benzoyl-CoA-dihydrodiol lyase